MEADKARTLSIGEVAIATGITPDTIRVWERRYGRPKPARLPSGHRRYTRDQVRWLRRVAEAMALGSRAGAAVKASDEDLDRMLAKPVTARGETRVIGELVELVRAYDRSRIADTLREQLALLGPRRFLDDCVAPLVTVVGRAWADGDLDVRHEHFVSEVVEDTLRTVRTSLPAAQTGLVILVTLPGETHGLGLQMAALICALTRVRTRILGTETPIAEIVDAARETEADAVGISVSLATGGIETDRKLADLRRALPDAGHLVIGGRGARGVRRPARGIDYVDGLPSFEAWLIELFGES